jgi:hypothetical protein
MVRNVEKLAWILLPTEYPELRRLNVPQLVTKTHISGFPCTIEPLHFVVVNVNSRGKLLLTNSQSRLM